MSVERMWSVGNLKLRWRKLAACDRVPTVQIGGGTRRKSAPPSRRRGGTLASVKLAPLKLRRHGTLRAHLLRVHNRLHPAQVLRHARADQQVVEILPLRDFLPRHAQALLNRRR